MFIMGGAMQSGYACDVQRWATFESALRSASFYIEKKGDIGTEVFVDIKSRKDGPHGIWVWTERQVTNNSGEFKVGLHWLAKNAGDEPYASRELAVEVEKLLLAAGATCTFCPVSEAIARL